MDWQGYPLQRPASPSSAINPKNLAMAQKTLCASMPFALLLATRRRSPACSTRLDHSAALPTTVAALNVDGKGQHMNNHLPLLRRDSQTFKTLKQYLPHRGAPLSPCGPFASLGVPNSNAETLANMLLDWPPRCALLHNWSRFKWSRAAQAFPC